MTYLTFWSNETNSYWYIGKEVLDIRNGRRGKVIILNPIGITNSIKIATKTGNRYFYKKSELRYLK